LCISGRARADVDGIFNWLVARSVSGAVSWYAAFIRTADNIRNAPESFGQAPEAHSLARNLRQQFSRPAAAGAIALFSKSMRTKPQFFAIVARAKPHCADVTFPSSNTQWRDAVRLSQTVTHL
jgi:plasmid stabilization system protein ParE